MSWINTNLLPYLNDALAEVVRDIKEARSNKEDMSSYGAGHDCGTRDTFDTVIEYIMQSSEDWNK